MNTKSGTSETFEYVSTLGTAFQVVVTLAQDNATGQYNGMAQAYEGNPNNSAYVGNAVTIPPFAAESAEAAYAQALQVIGAELDAGNLSTPGVIGWLTPGEVTGDSTPKQPVR